MKIGLLGGSFNPVHNGHIKLAQTALNSYQLDKVLFLPSGKHPLKSNEQSLPVKQRYVLTKKAIASYTHFEISKFDMDTERPSYTKFLINRIKKTFPKDQFYFIAGSDIISELPKWHDSKWLIENIKFIIAHRPNIDTSHWKTLEFVDKLEFMEMTPVDISSTKIREMIASKQDVSSYVPSVILEDIKKLYAN
ncbi:MAG: nicotinate-nucleotide adenylyltransferase [Candidatus Cloacimonetes bacterium]|nr:nicotinate-nucleotide adenylyltransferase [Candidatus Cloacimonadota bacterium]